MARGNIRFTPGLLTQLGSFGQGPANQQGAAGASMLPPAQQFGPSGLGGMFARNLGGLLGMDMRTPQERLGELASKGTGTFEEKMQVAQELAKTDPVRGLQLMESFKAEEAKEETRDTVASLVATRFKDREDVGDLVALAGQGASFTDIEKAANEKETSSLSPADRYKVVKGSVFDVVEQKYIAAPENLSEEAKRTQVIRTTDANGNEISRLINLADGETIAEYAVPEDPGGQSASLLKLNANLISSAEDFEKRAITADSILSKLDKLEGEVRGGVFNSLEEGFKQLTGTQDDISMLRIEQNRLITSSAVANLPKGPASDRDIGLVLRGELDFNAGPEAIASYARGIKKIAKFAARQARDQASWLDRYGDIRGFNSQQIVNKSKQELANIRSPASKIPQQAIERMIDNRDNTQARQDFINRYEVDIVQILEDMETATTTLSQLKRGF